MLAARLQLDNKNKRYFLMPFYENVRSLTIYSNWMAEQQIIKEYN